MKLWKKLQKILKLHDEKKIYVVNMLRWGSRENHSYIHSVHSTMQRAFDAAEKEARARGGKYEYEIMVCKLDQSSGRNIYLKSFDEPCNTGCEDNKCSLKKYITKGE